MAKDATAVTVDREQVRRVYSGRPGCACGCRGHYSTDPATITRIVNALNALGAKMDESGEFAWAETETRAYTAYFTAD